MTNDPRKHCPTCPVSLVCMAGRLKIYWRCAGCAKLMVETAPEEFSKKKAETHLIECGGNLPIPERDSVLPQMCSKCYFRDRQREDDRKYWHDTAFRR